MKLRIHKTLSRGVYRVNIVTEEWSEADTLLIAKFGEPEVDLGGSFTGPPAFSRDSKLHRLKTGGAMVFEVDVADEVDADDRAEVWLDEMTTRITDEVTTLRAQVDEYSGEQVVAVSHSTVLSQGDDGFTAEVQVEI